ncbi:MAG TPA: hypothetical protein VGL81_24625 [Polyangiaceae bacterium]
MTSRFLAPVAAVVVAMACSLVPSAAHADPVSDAKDLFTRGRELRAAGDCAGAVGVFRKAYDLYPEGLGSLRNVAECEESLGHFASSRRAWLDLSRALLTYRDKKYEGWDKDATDAAARLAPKLATLTIDLSVVGPGGEPESAHGVDVTLDSEKLASTLVGTPLERDPGRHTVRATGERVQGQAESDVDLAAGDAKRVALRVVVTPEAPEAAGTPLPVTPPLTPDDDAEHARRTKRTIAWAAIGVGAAGLVGAAISLGVRQSALGSLQSQCPGLSDCDPSRKASIDPILSRGQAASAAFDVLGIVGLVGAGSGIALLATSGHPQQARLVVTPTLGGASAAWRF